MKDKKENRVKTAVIVTTAILVLMSMLPAMVSAHLGVKINEIMYNPSAEQGSDSDMEWIELHNNDAEPINIGGWTIGGNQIGDMSHPDRILQPGELVVLARNKTAFDAYYGALPWSVIDVTFILKNAPGDTIVLRNSIGAEMDNVTYNASLGADGNGKTLERTATGAWAESTVDGGTPCAENGEAIVIRGPPGSPQNVKAAAGDDYVNLEWIAPSDDGGSEITNYNIYRGTTPGGETLLKAVGNVLIYRDNDVTSNQKYYYQVSAVNSVGEGEKSNRVDARPTPTPTPAPIVSTTTMPTPTPTPTTPTQTTAPLTPTPTPTPTTPTQTTAPLTPTPTPTPSRDWTIYLIGPLIGAVAIIIAALITSREKKKRGG